MSRRFISVLLALAVPLVCALPSALGRNRTPVLGWKRAFPSGKGFGVVKPRTVYLGGDPTGNVASITWHNWGSGRAVGFGQGWCPGRSVASGHPCRVPLHVYGLGTCHGLRSYRNLSFYFKPGRHRHWTPGSKWNICSGQFLPG